MIEILEIFRFFTIISKWKNQSIDNMMKMDRMMKFKMNLRTFQTHHVLGIVRIKWLKLMITRAITALQQNPLKKNRRGIKLKKRDWKKKQFRN
jgi:hypothetical protein